MSNRSPEHLVINAPPPLPLVTTYNKYIRHLYMYTTGKRKETYSTLYPFFITADVLVSKTSPP